MTKPTPLTRKAIIKAWRKAKLPRLFWRFNHPGWIWTGKEIAMCRNSVIRTGFDSLYAILEYIKEQTR